jgi:hypothetical protein
MAIRLNPISLSTARVARSDLSIAARFAAPHTDSQPRPVEMRRLLAIRPIEIAAITAILLNK